MSSFVLSFRAPKNRTLVAADEAAWGEWFKNIGGEVADFGHRVGMASPLGNCGDDTVLGGYVIVTADGLEAAVALARGCPGIQQGGGVEVGETVEMG